MRIVAAIIGLLAALTVFSAVQIPDASPLPKQPATPLQVPAQEARLASKPMRTETVKLRENSLALARAAKIRLARRDRGYRDDCSGFIASVLDEADALEVPQHATVAVFHADALQREALHHNPIPSIGDLAFFDNTWDRNGNGRMDDKNTHIGIVVDVEPDGTVVVAHKGSDYRLIRMNLFHPSDKESPDGVAWNSWLRRTGDRGNPLGMYRTGQLWSGFASP